jgi:(1->4)-alpha-D-glucan 1-alpha-D-glucosylmutase
MEQPVATYRFQLNASFTFNNLQQLLDYLHTLGISTIYASPVFAAPAGSTHGYDVSDPHALNPEIGTLDQWLQIARSMKQLNMTWLQDIVPNHMVFGTQNKRLADVWERGPFSAYYDYFDIDWKYPDPSITGKVMVPTLGRPFDDCIQNGEIRLALTEAGFVINYFDNQYPLSIDAYDNILSILPDEPAATALSNVLKQLYAQAILDRSLIEWQAFKQQLIKKFMAVEAHVTLAQKVIDTINQDQLLLHELLKEQYYQLCWWKETDQKINYRRFFAVNELIALRMEDEAVFYDYHHFIKSLYDQQLIHGLRIDHIDGLRSPGTYIKRLRQLFGDDCYIICEKILEQNETIPAHWYHAGALQGTTGYEFLSFTNWLLTHTTGARQLVDFYATLFPGTPAYNQIVFDKKSMFLQTYMGGEWNNLVRYLYTLNLATAAMKQEKIKEALGVFMCCLPVYRFYLDGQEPDTLSEQMLKETFREARHKSPGLEKELDWLQSLWQPFSDADKNKQRLAFLQRLMQFTGPLSAKGVEDTTFYVYNALLSHNEVGDTPGAIGFSTDHFHQRMQERREQHARSLNATSTHDTKRGEDGRIRLNVLSMFVNEWKQHVLQWKQMNEPLKLNLDNKQAPLPEDEYFIYQSILAGFPPDAQATETYITRLKEYFIKAVREAKLNSNWHQPDTAYEEACGRFIEAILSKNHSFLQRFLPFFETVQDYAAVFSLSQVLVKITAPGIPDIFQGCELWNYSYVDPDNRRPVDFQLRKQYLDELVQLDRRDPVELLNYIASKRKEGLEKLFVTWKALQCRKKLADLFTRGAYYPLYPNTECGIVAFARRHQNQWAIIAAPVLNTVMIPGTNKELWAGISLNLPAGSPVHWTNEFTGEHFSIQSALPLDVAFNAFPVALLIGQSSNTTI